jgi:lipoyl(octanoyl) transferase
MIWRLILDGAQTGAWNMAVDEALLLAQVPGSAPVLRCYAWNPACVSIGRFQTSKIKIQNSKLPFVRRPTGGRAIWHQHEVTYAVILREEILPREARSVVGSYEWLSRAFIEGLQSLGVQAQLAPGHKGALREENCFASSARSDFLVDGRKLIGAAQCRKNGAILQHGSLLLDVDEDAWREAVGGDLTGMISLRQLGVRAAPEEIVAALCDGVQTVLGAEWQRSTLREAEQSLAKQLEAQKYTQTAWNRDAQEP